MRFGLIGYGLWGTHHAEAITKAPGAELVAIACHSDATAKAAKARFPDATISIGYEALLQNPDIDAIDVAVPNHLHEEVAIAALRASKHVLLEKPMALSVPACDRLLDAAKSSGKVLTIGHELRFSTQWGTLKEVIDEGAIGTPLYACMNLFRFPYRQGSGGWRYDKDRVGSWILEEPIHFFDLLMWYLDGQGDPERLISFGNARTANADEKALMSDNFSTVMHWSGGSYAVVNQTLGGFEHHQVMEIVGSAGAIRTWWSGAQDRTRSPDFGIKIKRAGSEAVETLDVPPSGELFELDRELCLAVEAFNDGVPTVSGEDARKRILVCLAAEQSLLEGREISLSF